MSMMKLILGAKIQSNYLEIIIFVLHIAIYIYSGTSVFERPCIRTILFSTKNIELELFQLLTRFRYSINRQAREERICQRIIKE